MYYLHPPACTGINSNDCSISAPRRTRQETSPIVPLRAPALASEADPGLLETSRNRLSSNIQTTYQVGAEAARGAEELPALCD